VLVHPLSERLWSQLMLALYRSGRQAEALEAYRRAREALVEGRGLEPGPPLKRLEQGILRQERSLDLRSRSAPRGIPHSSTAFLGRDDELERLCALIRRPRLQLVTVTGIGGIGKSRLALRAAESLADEFTDGSCLVELASVAEPALVLPAIAQALGLQGVPDALEALRSHLGGQDLLLVLDNFEHVLAAAPELGRLLAVAPQLKILVTSAAALRLAAEHDFQLAPLALPGADVSDLAALEAVPAVALFVERARAARADFTLSAENAAAVAQLCIKLEGLPLAIELAAARCRTLPPATLLARLRTRLDVPAAARTDGPARQRTLRATLDWSYDVLEPAEQRLLSRLAVFAGGCTLEAVDAVCEAGDDQVDLLAGLVDKSFLRSAGETEPRFSLLETVREYAGERLIAEGADGDVRRRHAEYFLSFAERAEGMLGGPRQALWLAALEVEHDNFRAALAWSVGGQPETHVRLAAALARFWHVRGHVTEGCRWLEGAIDVAADLPAWIRAKLLHRTAALALRRGADERTRQLLEESLALHRRIGNADGVAATLQLLGQDACFHGDPERGGSLFREAVDILRTRDDQRMLSIALGNLGGVELQCRNFESAARWSAEATELARAVGDRSALALCLGNLGVALACEARGAEAAEALAEGLGVAHELGFEEQIAYALVGFAALAVLEGGHLHAAELLGAVDRACSDTGAALGPFERSLHDETAEQAQAALGADAFEAARSRGLAVTPAQAVELASRRAIPA
jgi:predicted ATPase